MLSFSQLAETFSQVLERDVSFEQITASEFVKRLQANHVDPGAIAMLSYLFTEVLDGRNAFVSDGVQRALGRPPKTFHAFVTANQSAFR